MKIDNDFTFYFSNINFKLPPRSAKRLKKKYISKKGSLAFYHPETRKIYLVKYPKFILLQYANGMNFKVTAKVHRLGFYIKPRKDIKSYERALQGYKHIKDVRDMYGRIFSHESIHKALDNIGELEACIKFDKIYI